MINKYLPFFVLIAVSGISIQEFIYGNMIDKFTSMLVLPFCVFTIIALIKESKRA